MSEDTEGQAPEGTENTDTGGSTTDQDKPKAPSGTNDAISSSLDEVDDVDVLKGMVKTLRTENGNHRRKNKEVETENAALKAWKMDHLKGVADAEERVAKADQVAKRYVVKAVALEFDIDDDLVDLLDGNTEEEIWAKGEKLANTRKKDSGARNPLDPAWVPGPTQLMPGKRGEPARQPAPQKEDTQWLRDAWSR